MRYTGLKRTMVRLILVAFVTFPIRPCTAQSFSIGVTPSSDILISKARPSSNDSGKNRDVALVDIKAVDAPALHTQNDQTAMAAQERLGQGVIINSNGIIATSKHIIGNAEHIYVSLSSGQVFEAVVLHHSQTDLSLIQIKAPMPLKAIALADSSSVQIGSPVMAITNAGLNSHRERDGQVSNVFKESSNDIEFLEMDISLKPGDSGGPILNAQGSLLGLIMGYPKSNPAKSYAIASSSILQEYHQYRKSILN